jgi:hypothetical protein
MLLAEDTGTHPPLDIDWSFARESAAGPFAAAQRIGLDEPATPAASPAPERPAMARGTAARASSTRPADSDGGAAFPTLREFAVAVNRSDPAALALATHGVTSDIPIDGADVRKLLGTMWFRSVVPRLSQAWRTRLLEALCGSLEIPDHIVALGRQQARLSELNSVRLREASTSLAVPEAIRADVQLLLMVVQVWGEDALRQCHFRGLAERPAASGFAGFLQSFRPKISRRS